MMSTLVDGGKQMHAGLLRLHTTNHQALVSNYQLFHFGSDLELKAETERWELGEAIQMKCSL